MIEEKYRHNLKVEWKRVGIARILKNEKIVLMDIKGYDLYKMLVVDVDLLMDLLNGKIGWVNIYARNRP